jgi:hypothetical protein
MEKGSFWLCELKNDICTEHFTEYFSSKKKHLKALVRTLPKKVDYQVERKIFSFQDISFIYCAYTRLLFSAQMFFLLRWVNTGQGGSGEGVLMTEINISVKQRRDEIKFEP